MLIFMLTISAASAYAQNSITTTFSSNNSYYGNMFDATTFGPQLTVTGIDINPVGTGTYIIEVYTKPGSYIGSETTPEDWTLVSTTEVTVSTANVPTFVDVTDFILPAASVTGMYITSTSGNRLGYTNGSTSYSNDEIMLTLGVGKGDLFGGTFNPRTWNGTIYYDSNQLPVADAGPDQSVVQGEEVCFDGGNSTDADDDELTYFWTLASWPAGSSAELNDPTAESTCIVADLPGTYEVSLVVNDGTEDSAAATAEAVAVSYLNAVTETLLEAGTVVNELDSTVFKGNNRKAEQRRKQLSRMVNRALSLADEDRYLRALEILQKDVLKRVDGCAASGQAEKNDWIQDCDAQEQVYLLIMEATRQGAFPKSR